MSGGYLEGFKKIYSGKNVLKSHLFLFALFVGLSIPSVIATLNVNSTNKEQLYNYIYIQHPVLGIVTILFSLLLNLYCVHFIHKALKFQIWKDTEQNEERIKAFPIMPDINFNFFKPLGKCILFWIIWLIYASIAPGILIINLAFAFAFAYGSAIVNKFISFAVIIYALFLAFTMPYVVTKFAKNFSVKEVLSPLITFDIIKRSFKETAIVFLKYIGILILFISAILAITIMFLIFISIILAVMKTANSAFIFKSPAILTIMTAIYMYLGSIIGFVFYYVIAEIYHAKIEKN